MALQGIPISEEQCIGDSLPVLNAAFSALDVGMTNNTADLTMLFNMLPNFTTIGQLSGYILAPPATSSGQLLTYNNSTSTWVSSAAPVDQSLLSQEGWARLHSGLELRWGEYMFEVGAVAYISFAKPFTNAIFGLIPVSPVPSIGVAVTGLSQLAANVTASTAPGSTSKGFYIAIGR